jgi:hypothetical protein
LHDSSDRPYIYNGALIVVGEDGSPYPLADFPPEYEDHLMGLYIDDERLRYREEWFQYLDALYN